MTPTPVTATHNPLRDARDLRLPRIAGPSALVIFGVTGDLARKKLMPAIYDLANRGLLPPGFSLVGFGRRDWTDAQFASQVKAACQAGARTSFREETWSQLVDGCRFVQGASFDDDAGYERLHATLSQLDAVRGAGGNHAFYLSIPPDAFPMVVSKLQQHRLSTPSTDAMYPDAWRRVVIEKPFGHDEESARALDSTVSEVFDDNSVFRIDHYLGKETVQNIMALRFGNQMFEPLWNANFVDHVQITMAEDIGIGGRAGYYDGVGAARDVIQNHLLQLMALVAMEEPANFDAAALRAEKIKLLQAVSLPEDLAKHTARGQYASAWQAGSKVCGFVEEEGFNPHSTTETYAAIRLDVKNRRWAGVPFYLRSGKRLGRRVTEVAVIFKTAPFLPFETTLTSDLGSNALVIRIQPDEGVTMRFGAKVPGTAMEVRDVTMDFGYGHAFTASSPEAYERLILDVLLGDPPLFPTAAEVELSWHILDPVTAYWASLPDQPQQYPAGSWGPQCADDMLAHDGRHWRRP